jgi:hypothetical protein
MAAQYHLRFDRFHLLYGFRDLHHLEDKHLLIKQFVLTFVPTLNVSKHLNYYSLSFRT